MITARSRRQWPLLVVVIGVAAGLVIATVGEDTWRFGCLVIGASLGVGAVERVALPRGEAGLLQVRSKPFDVAALGLCAAAIIALAIVVPPGR
jgi:DUF3017 family protein